MAAENTIPDKDQKDKPVLFLVDGSGYIFRAYFALPQNLTNPKGEPVGAVLGFCNMIYKLLNDMQAEYIAVVFDAARKNFRNDIYDAYKANRSEPPEDLIPQFPKFREASEAFGIPALEVEGYEADDLIASYAREARAQGMRVTIVGSDKDLMQLVNEDVRLYDPIKQKYIDSLAVQDKFGVMPEKMIDLQALAGDSVDNIPGVPGIGPKTAAQLIDEYGSLDELLNSLNQIKQPKRRETLENNIENARTSKELVKLADQVDLPLGLGDLEAHDPNRPHLQSYLEQEGFKTLLSRIQQANGDGVEKSRGQVNTEPQKIQAVRDKEYILVQSQETLQQLIQEASDAGVICFDTETTHLTPRYAKLVGISACVSPGRAYYIPLGHCANDQGELGRDDGEPLQLELESTLTALQPMMQDPAVLKVAQNGKYDLQILQSYTIEVSPIDDTMLMSYVLDGTSHGHGMDELAKIWLDYTPIKYEEVTGKGKAQVRFDQVSLDKALEYAAEDADITLQLYQLLKPRLVREKMAFIYEDLERPLITVVAGMERTGIKVDPVTLRRFSSDFGEQLRKLESKIYTLAGREFNIGSPKQLGTILFDELGYNGGKKTKGGDWSTDVNALEALDAQGVEIATEILEWRQLAKLKATYTDALQENIHAGTGRVHTSYSMAGTSTGRLASSDPNLQNIPIRTENGRKIREAFIAEEGHVLLSVDYSQIELRLAAEMAGITALQKAFKEGEDIHALTASQVFDVPMEQMTPEIRRQAKAINFGIIYGISGYGLGKQLGIEASEANHFIRTYLSRFGELQEYMERIKEEARKFGYVRTMFGRKCFIAGINEHNHARKTGAERQAINAPLQGTAADIIKKAMIKLWAAQQAGILGATRMLLQVHDELIFEVQEDEVEERAVQIKALMEGVVKLDTPLVAEAGWGKTWATAH